jgi:predicted ATPase
MVLGVCNHFVEQTHGPAALLQRADEMAALCTEHGLPYWGAGAPLARGKALAALGRAEQAVALLSEGLANLRATGAVTAVPFFIIWLAEVLGKVGRSTEGLDQLREVERHIEATEERWLESEMHRVRGELFVAAGDTVAAERSLLKGVAVARRQNSKFLEIRAATSLVRLWRDQGKRTEGRDLLTPIYGWFTEGFDTPLLQDAKALLDQLA